MTPISGYLGAIAANGPVSLTMPSTITTAPSGITPDAPRRGSVIAYAPRMMMVSVIALHPCNSARLPWRAWTREVAGDDPGTLADAALALAYFGEDIGAMIALVDRALALNPNFARGWHVSGILREWAGQPDIAIEHLEAALRLSPRVRIGSSLAFIGI